MSDIENSDTADSFNHSSSFDSTNSFYSTTTSDSSLHSSIIEDETRFDAAYQAQVSEKVNLVLREISHDGRFQSLLDLPSVKVDTSTDPSTPFCFRTTAQFPDHSAASAFALFAAIPQRAKWDAMCQSIHVLKTIDPLTFIYHLKLNATWPTTPRDSLMMAAFRKLTDGRYISVAWSIEDDLLCPADPTGAYIRMHTRISANLFTPNQKSGFILSQLIDADPKGSIPSYVIKKVSAKSFPATIESIKQAINPKDDHFYNQLISQLQDQPSQEFQTREVCDENTLLLREIQFRLDRIETRLKAKEVQQQSQIQQSQILTVYAPLALSAASLLLLLNLNLRKK